MDKQIFFNDYHPVRIYSNRQTLFELLLAMINNVLIIIIMK